MKIFIVGSGLLVTVVVGAWLRGASAVPPQQSRTLPTAATEAFDVLRRDVLRIAEPAMRSWLAAIGTDAIANYGFRSPSELNKANLDTPIPIFTPRRAPNLANKIAVEQILIQRPVSWLVPVIVDKRVVSVMKVDYMEGREPSATGFGMMYTANRLNAGLSLLGQLSESDRKNLIYLSFVEPVTDILLLRISDNSWKWLNLIGTTDAQASMLSDVEIASLLRVLSVVPDNAK